MISSRPLDGQTYLVDIMQRYGYQAEKLCYGLTLTAVQALLLNQRDVFDARLASLYALHMQALTPQVASLTADIRAFFESVLFHQQPNKYAAWFGNQGPYFQLSTLTFPYVCPTLLEIADTQPITVFSGVYSKAELRTYFESLQRAITSREEALTHPVTFVLRRHNHTLTIAYDDTDKSWILYDWIAGDLTSRVFQCTDEMARAVQHAFHVSTAAIFATTAYATSANAPLMRQILTAWQEQPAYQALHAVTQEKATMTVKGGSTWLLLAALTRDLPLSTALLAQGANPKQPRRDGLTPLKVVTCYRDRDLKTLFTNAADLARSRHQEQASSVSPAL